METGEEMMTSTHKDGRYHHGDLRRALLDAALQLATKHGIHSFTLREVARQAGVSHNAPYYHFADKAALVEALALEIFAAFTAAIRGAGGTTPGTALDKLLASGVAYVRFAQEHPAAFRIMFRPELRQPGMATANEEMEALSPVDQAALNAYRVLLDAIVVCQDTGLLPPGNPSPLAVTAWVTVHGLATLLLDGALRRVNGIAVDPKGMEQIAETVMKTLAHGLCAR